VLRPIPAPLADLQPKRCDIAACLGRHGQQKHVCSTRYKPSWCTSQIKRSHTTIPSAWQKSPSASSTVHTERLIPALRTCLETCKHWQLICRIAGRRSTALSSSRTCPHRLASIGSHTNNPTSSSAPATISTLTTPAIRRQASKTSLVSYQSQHPGLNSQQTPAAHTMPRASGSQQQVSRR